MRAASHFPNVCVAEVATSLCVDEIFIGELLENRAGSLFCKVITAWYCNLSHLTVGSDFSVSQLSICLLILCRQVQDRVGCESSRDIVCFSLDRNTASQ